jgi:hypothetical protein
MTQKRKIMPYVALAGAIVCGLILVLAVVGVTMQVRADHTASAAAKTTSSTLDASARRACDTLAGGYKGAVTHQARIDLAGKVAKHAAASNNRNLIDLATVLGRGADASAAAWTMASDAFSQACFDAGWTGE